MNLTNTDCVVRGIIPILVNVPVREKLALSRE